MDKITDIVSRRAAAYKELKETDSQILKWFGFIEAAKAGQTFPDIESEYNAIKDKIKCTLTEYYVITTLIEKTVLNKDYNL